jgi:hypothetical protein
MTVTVEHAHYWRIEIPHGYESPAKCKVCGAERTFYNYELPRHSRRLQCRLCKTSKPFNSDYFTKAETRGLTSLCIECAGKKGAGPKRLTW